MKYDGNVYVHGKLEVIIHANVDDLMVLGETTHIQEIFRGIHQVLLIRQTRHLNEECSTLQFLGRTVQRSISRVLLYDNKQYYVQELQRLGMENGTETTTPTTVTKNNQPRRISGFKPTRAVSTDGWNASMATSHEARRGVHNQRVSTKLKRTNRKLIQKTEAFTDVHHYSVSCI